MATELQSPSDEALARQAQAGELAGFEELVRRHEARLFRFLANFCRNETDAQELAQETFVTAYLKLGRFNPAKSFATWLFTIARRKCIDHHRAQRPSADQPLPEPHDANDPASLLARREEQQDLWRLARRLLPKLQFQALWLRYVEEMRVGDIARVLRRTQTHVKVLLFRARATLLRELESQRASAELAQRTDFRFRENAPRPAALAPTPVKLAGAARNPS